MGKKLGRIALGVGTMGGSEVARAAGKKLGLGMEDEQGAFATPEQQQQANYREFANRFDTEMNAADKGVQESALTRGVYGEGGLQSQLGDEGRQLADSGFQLQKGDREAYGQASGDISRLFGQQEQQATQNLARRGLASASSGAAGATFSGLQGNKNEMLASAQMDIAQKRMEDTQKRLVQNRQMQQQLATQGAALSQSRFQDKGDGLLNSVKVESQGNADKRQSLADQQAAVKPGLFSTIGQGLQGGLGTLASQAPGMLVTGGMPTGGLFGAAKKAVNPLANKNQYGVDGAGGTTSYSTSYLND
jgi:hypothetical protein